MREKAQYYIAKAEVDVGYPDLVELLKDKDINEM